MLPITLKPSAGITDDAPKPRVSYSSSVMFLKLRLKRCGAAVPGDARRPRSARRRARRRCPRPRTARRRSGRRPATPKPPLEALAHPQAREVLRREGRVVARAVEGEEDRRREAHLHQLGELGQLGVGPGVGELSPGARREARPRGRSSRPRERWLPVCWVTPLSSGMATFSRSSWKQGDRGLQAAAEQVGLDPDLGLGALLGLALPRRPAGGRREGLRAVGVEGQARRGRRRPGPPSATARSRRGWCGSPGRRSRACRSARRPSPGSARRSGSGRSGRAPGCGSRRRPARPWPGSWNSGPGAVSTGDQEVDARQQKGVDGELVGEHPGLDAGEQPVLDAARAGGDHGLELVAGQALAVVEPRQHAGDLQPAGGPAREGRREERAVRLPVEVAVVELVAQGEAVAEGVLEVHLGAVQAAGRSSRTASRRNARAARRRSPSRRR